jgi:hypothetical protein
MVIDHRPNRLCSDNQENVLTIELIDKCQLTSDCSSFLRCKMSRYSPSNVLDLSCSCCCRREWFAMHVAHDVRHSSVSCRLVVLPWDWSISCTYNDIQWRGSQIYQFSRQQRREADQTYKTHGQEQPSSLQPLNEQPNGACVRDLEVLWSAATAQR